MPPPISQASPANLPTLRTLAIETFSDTWAVHNTPEDMADYLGTAYSEENLARELASPDYAFFLAWENDQAIGFAKMRAEEVPPGLEAQRPIELSHLYVRKAWHDKKVGAALMAHCLQYARSNGHDVLWLGVWEHNTRAMAFYQKWGFTVFGSHIFELGQARDTDLLMRLAL